MSEQSTSDQSTSDQSESLAVLFGLDKSVKADRRLDAADVAALTAKIGNIIHGGLPAQHIPRASAETLSLLCGALAKPFTTLLTDAWNKRQEFAKFTDAARYPPDEVSRVVLRPHKIKWTYRPAIDILLGEKSVRKLVFIVETEFGLDGAEVVVQGGKFMRMHTGKSSIAATLRYGDVVLVKRTLGEYTLPGVIPFGSNGVEIARVMSPFSYKPPAADASAASARPPA